MKTTRQYLAAVKAKLGISSDYALQKPLGLSKQGVSYLANGGVMSTTTAAKVAELLELDPLKVIADAELERGSSPELWKRIRAAAAIAGAIGGAVLAAHFARSSGADPDQVLAAAALFTGDPDGLRIMLNTLSGGAGAIALSIGLVLAFVSRVHKGLSISLRPA